MVWQLRDPTFRQAIHSLCDTVGGRCALAGTVGVQVHLARAVGANKLGPPAHGIEIVSFAATPCPERVHGVPVALVDAMGFDASVEAGRAVIEIDAEMFPVALPEHILGMCLGAPDLPPDAKWACFVLMRALDGRIDLEQARGFLKRGSSVERQALLAELAYLAA
ncbi:MAG: hypothetical protein HY744_25600 [Deltaproteobacteria bacterium]|nr:hypothetical protein [Deltaproteobacteria bacterium]